MCSARSHRFSIHSTEIMNVNICTMLFVCVSWMHDCQLEWIELYWVCYKHAIQCLSYVSRTNLQNPGASPSQPHRREIYIRRETSRRQLTHACSCTQILCIHVACLSSLLSLFCTCTTEGSWMKHKSTVPTCTVQNSALQTISNTSTQVHACLCLITMEEGIVKLFKIHKKKKKEINKSMNASTQRECVTECGSAPHCSVWTRWRLKK